MREFANLACCKLQPVSFSLNIEKPSCGERGEWKERVQAKKRGDDVRVCGTERKGKNGINVDGKEENRRNKKEEREVGEYLQW